jgi:pSer/pThr/pTyr-binding forkhead associated (FHA) protein
MITDHPEMITDHPESRLVVTATDDRREFVLEGDHVLVGRAAACDIVLADETVSRSHARVERRGSGFVIEDLGTPNGTFVNGARVERMTLSPGDTIAIGKSSMRFEAGRPAPEPDVTAISTEAELETILSEETVTVRVHNASHPLFVAHLAGRTWEVPLTEDVLAIGRHPTNDVVVKTPGASRQHARVERRGDAVSIRDLESANGTRVNGERVNERTLEDGDTIRIGEARFVFKAGVASAEQTLADLTATGGGDVLKPVVFLPGIMGSELWTGNEQIWPNLKTLFVNPDPLALPERRPLEPRRIVRQVVIVPNLLKNDRYIRLGNYLEEGLGYERGKNLLEFAYDWRQDNRVSARHLAAAIDEWQRRSSDAARPITIIAHSMGSLVSRYYVEHLGGKEKVERMIFLGGPHHGAPKAISVLLFGPKKIPFGRVGEKLRDVVRTFPSMYQLLPTYSCGVDQSGERINVLADEMWISEHERALLRDARKFRRELGTRSSVPAVCIFGYGLRTITGISVHRGSERHWEKVELSTGRGDDMVPEPSAVLKGAEIHPVRQHHGALYTDKDVKKRLKLELTRRA